MTTAPTRSNAGRPRSSEADQAILATALRLLIEQGYDAMSIEGVASAAGVGKTTIYRRYPGKRDLIVAAVSSRVETVAVPTDQGSVRAELTLFMSEMIALFTREFGFSILATLLMKEREDPLLLELFRERVIRPRIEIMNGLLQRGIARGELRPDLPISLATQMLIGTIWTRHISGQAEGEEWLPAAIDMLIAGISAR